MCDIGNAWNDFTSAVSNIVSNPVVDTVAAAVLTDGTSLVDSAPAFLPEACLLYTSDAADE